MVLMVMMMMQAIANTQFGFCSSQQTPNNTQEIVLFRSARPGRRDALGLTQIEHVSRTRFPSPEAQALLRFRNGLVLGVNDHPRIFALSQEIPDS